MKDNVRKAVESENEHELLEYLDYRHTKKIDSDQFYLVEKVLKGTWHNQHEDLVNMIFLENLKDDRFVEPILNIAMNKRVFR